MSRFDDSCEPGDMPAVFWEIDLRRALTSGRGQRILRDVEAALLAMPKHELLYGEIVEAGCWDDHDDVRIPTGAVCAIGAYAVHRGIQDGKSREQALADLAERWSGDRDQWETEILGRSLGLARTVATQLAWLNDEAYGSLTPPERHAAVLAWVRDQIKPEPAEVPA